jgi:hypothetical protein
VIARAATGDAQGPDAVTLPTEREYGVRVSPLDAAYDSDCGNLRDNMVVKPKFRGRIIAVDPSGHVGPG